MKYYHVTAEKYWSQIKTQGLIPSKQKRGQGFEDSPHGIYLFNTKIEAEEGVCNWLGDCFEEDEVLICLEVEISSSELIPDPELPLSASICLKPIPASSIINLGEI